MTTARLSARFLALLLLSAPLAHGADWPMWRANAGRDASTPERLAEGLSLSWSRAFAEPDPAWRSARLGFDHGLEPIVHEGRIFVGSSRDDSLTALSLETGEILWRYLAGGPIRFAPVAVDAPEAGDESLVLVASDDGFLHAVSSRTGQRAWRFRAAPSRRKTIGNRRLISLWPVRGGPVVASDAEGRPTVYFAAGVWSFEGVWVWALDALTGEPRWVNDSTGHVFGSHPHGAEAIGGLTPQGYLVVSGDDLFVPCGTAYPARLDRRDGQLLDFALPAQSRLPGGWFAYADPEASKAARRGELRFDTNVNRERHEDNLRKGRGEDGGLRRVIAAGESISLKSWPARVPQPDGSAELHSLIVLRDGALVVTRDHEILAYSNAAREGKPRRHERETPRAFPAKPSPALARSIAGRALAGHALTVGASLDDLVSLTRESDLHVTAVETRDPKSLRASLHELGLLGTRVTVCEDSLVDAELPPWTMTFAYVVAWPDGDERADLRFAESLFGVLRPYGGAARILEATRSVAAFEKTREQLREASVERSDDSMRTEIVFAGETAIAFEVRRHGPLLGAVDYTGGWSSPDAVVRAPLGVLWFDDTLGHFKRAPQPMVIGGVLVSNQKTWLPTEPRKAGAGYALEAPIYSDVYTGRRLSDAEAAALAKTLPGHDRSQRQPSQYRPPYQKNDWKPEPPRPGTRISPLTLEQEPRAIQKSYGCDGGVDYGDVYTLRSGTAAFYDKTLESGTIHVSGPRSGCTNSLIPANGVLNVPYFYEGCTCSYPLPSGLAMVSMPETHEQWAIYGKGSPTGIRRVGINLGAPGDRMTREGTLWLEHPPRSGPSPEVPVTLEPPAPRAFYRHALNVRGGHGWPWVCASGIEGLRTIRVGSLANGRVRVRLHFAEPAPRREGERVFDVTVAASTDRPTKIEGIDPAREAGGAMRGLVREVDALVEDGTLEIRLTPRVGETLLSGLEIIDARLDALPPRAIPEREIRPLEREPAKR